MTKNPMLKQENKYSKENVVVITRKDELLGIIWTGTDRKKVHYKVAPMDDDEIISLYTDQRSNQNDLSST